MRKLTTTFWQKIGNYLHEVACDYYYNYEGTKLISSSEMYYTGNTRCA